MTGCGSGTLTLHGKERDSVGTALSAMSVHSGPGEDEAWPEAAVASFG